MPSTKYPNSGIFGGWNRGESGWGYEMNKNLLLTDALLHAVVKSKIKSIPATVKLGDLYLVDTTGLSTALSNKKNHLILFRSSDKTEYIDIPPLTGYKIYLLSDSKSYIYRDGAWIAAIATSLTDSDEEKAASAKLTYELNKKISDINVNLSNRIDNVEGDLSNLEENFNNFKTDTNKKISDTNKRIDGLEGDLANTNKRIDNLEDDLSNTNKRIDNIENDFNNLETDITQKVDGLEDRFNDFNMIPGNWISRAANTTYTAETNGYIFYVVTGGYHCATGTLYINEMAQYLAVSEYGSGSCTERNAFTVPVSKGTTYRGTYSASGNLYWIPATS